MLFFPVDQTVSVIHWRSRLFLLILGFFQDSERRERLLSDAKKLQEKTEKKRLKKKVLWMTCSCDFRRNEGVTFFTFHCSLNLEAEGEKTVGEAEKRGGETRSERKGPDKLTFEEQRRQTKSIVFTFTSFASQEANDSVERNAAESKPGHDDVDELAMTIHTKLRRLSSEKSSEEESVGNSEVTAVYCYSFISSHSLNDQGHCV